MNTKLHEITVREITENYIDNAEDGVTGYNGRLDIRHAFQREFVYKEKQRNAVIETIQKGFPLNVMYWIKREDGHFDLLDGQQRTVSICQYVNGDFSLNYRTFFNLTKTEQELRNAMYTGEWLYEAKRYFSKTYCPAYQIAEKKPATNLRQSPRSARAKSTKSKATARFSLTTPKNYGMRSEPAGFLQAR